MLLMQENLRHSELILNQTWKILKNSVRSDIAMWLIQCFNLQLLIIILFFTHLKELYIMNNYDNDDIFIFIFVNLLHI